MDILLVVDNTGSMGRSCSSARISASEIGTMVNLLLEREALDFAVYGDYDSSTPNSERGGWSLASKDSPNTNSWFNKFMKPCGGGGRPEATKTAFNHILDLDPHIVFHYTDAPPHGTETLQLDREGKFEKRYLEENGYETDWSVLSQKVRTKHRVITFLTSSSSTLINLYTKIGDVVIITDNTVKSITKNMMNVFNTLFGIVSQPEEVTYYQLDENSIIPMREWTCESCTFLNTKQQKKCEMCEQSRTQKTNKTGYKTTTFLEPHFHVDIRKAVLESDPEKVLTAFDRLLDPKYPDRAICLSTNPVLGKFWRRICGRILHGGDTSYKTRAEQIIDKFSNIKGKMKQENQKIMKEWLDSSFDLTPIIRDLTEKYLDAKSFLSLPHTPDILVDDIIALSRGGGSFRELSIAIGGIILSDTETSLQLPQEEDEAPDFIPMHDEIAPIDIFRLIANLLKLGLLFSEFTAILAAILSLHNRYLADFAKNLLAEKKGQWIDWTLKDDETQNNPTHWSMNFMRILSILPDEFLTGKEVLFRDKYLKIARLLQNHSALISVQIPFVPKDKTRVGKTWKRLCKKCGHKRCFTLFPGQSKQCAVCIAFSKPDKNTIEEYKSKKLSIIPSEIVEKCSETETNWANCSSCRVNYSIVRVCALNVRPKCHYCREGKKVYFLLRKKVPTIECCVCGHKYISESGAVQIVAPDECKTSLFHLKSSNQFICPRCFQSKIPMTTEIEIKIEEIIAENPLISKLIPYGPYDKIIDSGTKLWKRILNAKKINTVSKLTINLTYKGLPILKSQEILKNCLDTLNGTNDRVTCLMCIDDTYSGNIIPACGNCQNRICRNCVKRWYSQAETGKIVSKCNTECPYCKCSPKFDIIKGTFLKYLTNLRKTKGNRGIIYEWDRNFIHAVCRDCLKVAPAVARECAQQAPNIKDFVCEGCLEERRRLRQDDELALAALATKKCPSCEVYTQKISGCNHITCTSCNSHWCWCCGSGTSHGIKFNSNSIYDHLSKECEGIFS